MGKPRSVRSRKTDTYINRGHSSQYDTEDSEINTLYTTDDEPCHSESDQVNEVSNDLSCIETEEEETIVLRPRSKLSKRPSPRKTGSPRRSSRYQKQNDIENKSEPQNQGDSGVYDSIKVAIQDMTGQVVSAIQNAFTGITKQYRHNNASSQQQKHAKSTTIANNSNSFLKLQGEAGDFVFDQLNSKTLKNYSKLATELKNRFGVFENKRAYKVQFNRRTQKPNEDTADYAAELKRLYDKAYSNRHAKIRQEDLLQRFLMGLSDTEARIYLEAS
ncbi:Hypothetical predicted protein [Mytilus galloprovincialis]|uniref:Retrotransposon gag domain-containing protein n=1 Tax=Mytilus galloprovincialis TaxID=29158 RepID=A0A8B6DEZ9_MYTGA|nr:Hypothetical predicted protein [Mytilus galloprovincialis]